MKQRILFVDDEPNILKGLQRSLRPLRKHWEMVFTDSPQAALEILGGRGFDVIVTDMRMPGMDGAQLLKKVRETYPAMVRIILSGHSDQEVAMRSVKSAHQYLAKPCDKAVLVNAVTRACSLRELMNKKAMPLVIGGIGAMPILPALYARIMEELRSPSASTASIGRIISQDIVMTAKVLQLVNSSFFGMPRHVSSPSEAVVLLGIDVVKTLILSLEVFSRFQDATLSILPVSRIYDHCVKTGVIARKIARAEKMKKEKIDNAMISGVLHDFGQLLLVEKFPDEYRQVVDHAQRERLPIHQAEMERFGVTHAEIGGCLLGLWGLPDNIVEGVAFHHNPGVCITREFDLCGIVHVANLVEKHERAMPGTWERLQGVDTAYLEKHGLSGRLRLWRDYLRQP